MEISYDLIIKYLCPNNIISHKKYEYKSTLQNTRDDNFPEKLSIILKDYKIYGIKSYDNNLSFWAALLTIINNEFIISLDYDDIAFINIYKNKLIDKYSKSKLFFKQDKCDIRELFKLNPTINTLQYISDIMNYTIIICDMNVDKMYIVYNSNYINPEHEVILLSKYNDLWEPIVKNNKKIFNYNDVSELINDISYYDNIKILKLKPDIDCENINKTKLIKMKINEVILLCEKLNITLPIKYNKNILINLVLENI